MILQRRLTIFWRVLLFSATIHYEIFPQKTQIFLHFLFTSYVFDDDFGNCHFSLRFSAYVMQESTISSSLDQTKRCKHQVFTLYNQLIETNTCNFDFTLINNAQIFRQVGSKKIKIRKHICNLQLDNMSCSIMRAEHIWASRKDTDVKKIFVDA